MIRKTLLILLVLGLVLISIGLEASGDSDVPVITHSSVVIDFPASLTFKISARSEAKINEIRLSYQVRRLEHARIVTEIYLPVTPATSVSTQWLWDMRMTGGFPPGASLDYWWTVSDATGKRLETVPERLTIQDDRYDWKSLTAGQVTLYWYRGDNSFAGQLMEATLAALERLKANTGAELEKPVSLYVYASATDLQESMIFPQEWTGGVAFTEYGIIAIGIGTDPREIEWGRRTIPHELTHLVIHQVTFNPYNYLPTWLDEGLAMNAEGELSSQFQTALARARLKNAFISLRSLASPFSAYTEQSILSYAESYEAVTYLIKEYGRDRMLELLQTFRQGSGHDEALMKVYGFDTDGLDARLRAVLETAAIP